MSKLDFLVTLNFVHCAYNFVTHKWETSNIFNTQSWHEEYVWRSIQKCDIVHKCLNIKENSGNMPYCNSLFHLLHTVPYNLASLMLSYLFLHCCIFPFNERYGCCLNTFLWYEPHWFKFWVFLLNSLNYNNALLLFHNCCDFIVTVM